MTDKQAFEEQKLELLRKGDWRALKELLFAVISDEAAEAGMHKARAVVLKFPDEVRWESIEWLRARGMRLYAGQPLPDTIEELDKL